MVCTNPLYLSGRILMALVPLPCGKCVACRINRAREWSFRMVAESGYWPESAFLTLTYFDDQQINLDKSHLQKAFKRARKSGLSFSYYACGEYGGDSRRPHYHVCLFYRGDLGFAYDRSYGEKNGHLTWWPHGLVNRGDFNPQSARYTADYLLKSLGDPSPIELEPPFRLLSIGLGKRYLEDNWLAIRNQDGVIPFAGSQVMVPRSYRRLLFPSVFRPRDKRRLLEYKKRVFETVLCREYEPARRAQREKNITVRQELYKKEF